MKSTVPKVKMMTAITTTSVGERPVACAAVEAEVELAVAVELEVDDV